MTPKRLRIWRQRLGLSQREVAAVIGVSITTLSRYERGVPHAISAEKVDRAESFILRRALEGAA